MRALSLFIPALAILSSTACNYDGDWLFARPTEVAGVIDLGEIVPVPITSLDDVADAVQMFEVGATGSAELGGVTFNVVGNGGSMCIWADPELAYWNESVAQIGTVTEYSYPDNNFDDGDLDLSAGFSVYYTGTPGEQIGDFEIRYEDSLGQQIPIQLNECGNLLGGRGAPESCTLSATQPGVSYTVLLETFSTPLDDDRLAFGLFVATSSCKDLYEDVIGAWPDECVVLGEAIDPTTATVDENGVYTSGTAYEGTEEFEMAFCASLGGSPALAEYCIAEAAAKDCEVDHCFCGDPASSPTDETY